MAFPLLLITGQEGKSYYALAQQTTVPAAFYIPNDQNGNNIFA